MRIHLNHPIINIDGEKYQIRYVRGKEWYGRREVLCSKNDRGNYILYYNTMKDLIPWCQFHYAVTGRKLKKEGLDRNGKPTGLYMIGVLLIPDNGNEPFLATLYLTKVQR